jgi:CxxC-x17-CxxC domain-containing protein
MEFQDRPITCLDCKNEFVFTAGEQEFYDRKGFREVPKRCKPCRDARKTRRNGDGNGYANGNGNGHGYANGDGGYGGGNRAPRGAREMFDATCAGCGGQARVPFQPQNGRPVYCRDCFNNKGSGYGGGY